MVLVVKAAIIMNVIVLELWVVNVIVVNAIVVAVDLLFWHCRCAGVGHAYRCCECRRGEVLAVDAVVVAAKACWILRGACDGHVHICCTCYHCECRCNRRHRRAFLKSLSCICNRGCRLLSLGVGHAVVACVFAWLPSL